ncbi:hypothetical protein EV644_108197 [Kribbella orskensis]|uniref:Uncharacterized protein n=1 Tax=Kribbella orskensis TaxID=2512216 RepID=A0ABY2BI58_9ACTN|nr:MULTISPECIES: hypothetical protein [Kribbella]TCN38802.1 hypothetical protein EV642_108197 [Kribbella sp. VKM Ac-2500]TCO20983.1 hypothetical protein EV644_108197 [Kribbella orskensis]
MDAAAVQKLMLELPGVEEHEGWRLTAPKYLIAQLDERPWPSGSAQYCAQP